MNDFGWCKTEAKFFAWLNSQMRNSFWKKHPVRLEMLKTGRKQMRNPKTGRLAFFHQCEKCEKWWPQDDIEINHKETVGTLNKDTLGDVFKRMALVDKSALEKLCKTCHAIVTYSERSGMTLEEASIEKQVIRFFNTYPAAEQKRRMKLGGMEPAATVAARRIQLREYLRERKRNSANISAQQNSGPSPDPADASEKA